MEVQCFEIRGKVNIEKLQNYPSLVSHSIFSVLMSEFYIVSWLLILLCILAWTLTCMDSNKRVHKQTNNKQTSMYAWAFKNRTQIIYSHRTFTGKSMQIKPLPLHLLKTFTNEMAGAWFAWIFMFIVTGMFVFINVHWCQWSDQGSI